MGAAPVGLGDWDEGDGHKMHYPQLPKPGGFDVAFNQGRLADDWECSETGPVTDIHFWVSWQMDEVWPIEGFGARIWSDNPMGINGWSEPNELLWERDFIVGEFTVRDMPDDLQGWFDPISGFFEPVDHTTWQQINVVDIQDPFDQNEGEIYWLEIDMWGAPNCGWKQSGEPQFRDDAVMWYSYWLELRDPETDESVDLAFVITSEPNLDFGDAPEGNSVDPVVAYPSSGVLGAFPTCKTVMTAGYVEHASSGLVYFGTPGVLPGIDMEADGDAGLCPPPGCFPPYNDDECFMDGDAGLTIPPGYTIQGGVVVLCLATQTGALGNVCALAQWGVDIDIRVVNQSDNDMFVNVLMDWTQNGQWGDAAICGVVWVVEHALMNFVVPAGYVGPLSGVPGGPPPPLWIGPNAGYAWARFSISEQPVPINWDGDGIFAEGETEDYLLRVDKELDFGDAPDPTYPTVLASDGARHVIMPWIHLGDGVDAEPNGQPDPQALGDDMNILYPGTPFPPGDEDGVVFTGPLTPGAWATVDVNSSAGGFLDAWIDFGGDGGWAQPVDQIFASLPLGIGINPLAFWVPFGANPGQTFARFRLSSNGGLSYDGPATDGEVEDYMVDIEENPAIKWMQLPDTSPNGIDIRVNRGRWLADDFECTSYGPITDVHLWGSWKGDANSLITRIHLSFHSDDPVGPGGSDPCNLYSMPDRLLWEKDFFGGDFGETLIIDLCAFPPHIGEYWWDPYDDTWVPNGDCKIWRIDINIPVEQAFFQDGDPCNPVIYWLDVQVDTQDGRFGWKTRRMPEHYMDDAVFDRGSELPRLWRDLHYPPFHPYYPNSIDMAFVITGEEWERPKEPTPHLKWSQPPIQIDPALWKTPEYCGWDQTSLTIDPCNYWMVVADDFRCLGTMPVASVHWWGSHIDWSEPCLPPILPSEWRIGFWS
ncbi:MAG: DUF7901 domain-containing protein, partial [Planctomycetota bacterium]